MKVYLFAALAAMVYADGGGYGHGGGVAYSAHASNYGYSDPAQTYFAPAQSYQTYYSPIQSGGYGGKGGKGNFGGGYNHGIEETVTIPLYRKPKGGHGGKGGGKGGLSKWLKFPALKAEVLYFPVNIPILDIFGSKGKGSGKKGGGDGGYADYGYQSYQPVATYQPAYHAQQAYQAQPIYQTASYQDPGYQSVAYQDSNYQYPSSYEY